MLVGDGKDRMVSIKLSVGRTPVAETRKPTKSTSISANWNLAGLMMMPCRPHRSKNSQVRKNCCSMVSSKKRVSSTHRLLLSKFSKSLSMRSVKPSPLGRRP